MSTGAGLRRHIVETPEQAATREQRNARARARRGGQTEYQLQLECVAWARSAGIMLLHVPNQLAARNRRQGAQSKALGVSAGVADLLILSRCRDATVRGLAIELKTSTGKVSAVQRSWASAATEQGWSCHVCRSLTDFQRICREILLGL